jgi:uncharacterized protein (TIRG00374 family)
VSQETRPVDQNSPRKGWFHREWRLLVGLSLSALCLFLAFRKLSLSDLQEALSIARWGWVALAIIAVLTSTFLKAVRWRVLFHPRQIPLPRIWSVYMIGQMLNAVFPARAGDVGRIYFIGEDEDISRAAALSTVIVEKVTDLVMLSLAFLVVAMWLVTIPTGIPAWLQKAGMALIPLTILALAILLLSAYAGHPIWHLLAKGLKPLPAPWQTAIDSAAKQAIDALENFRRSQVSVQVWGWSLVAWVLMALINGLLFPAFALDLSPFVAILLLVVLMSGVAVPPLPGNLGVYVYLCQLVLSLFGVSRETALAYGITLQVVTYIPLIVIGAACMLWENWSRRRSSPASHQVR